MSEEFLKFLEVENNFTETEKGAIALKSTESDLVDLFASIGALRDQPIERIVSKFSKAFSEDKLLAMKILFYARDIRGGLGEREIPRIIYYFLGNVHTDIIRKNLHNISEYGRWDDLFSLISTKLKDDIIKLIHNQLLEDVESEYPSLLAKWMPSVNTSNKNRVQLANMIADSMNISKTYNKNLDRKLYRKLLSKLRTKIDVIERKMCSNVFDKIEYSKVPSRAMNIYRNCFKKRDENRFDLYLESLAKGETKINSSTLYPYDIIEKLNRYTVDTVLEEQWKALPNYIEGENNILIMADTSGSMSGRPMDTSIGLAIYFAERNKGYYHNKFMTFSSNPEFITLKGNTLQEKRFNIREIVDSTNLKKAFDLILHTAIRNNISQKDLPKTLIIISDMQFDSIESYNSSHQMIWYDAIKLEFENNNYKIPNIVFWNVNDRKDSYQATSQYKGVQLVSGQSTAIFKTLLKNIGKTPYEAMLSTLNDNRYDGVVI